MYMCYLLQYYLGSGLLWNVFLVSRSATTELYLVQHVPMLLSVAYPLHHEIRPVMYVLFSQLEVNYASRS